MIDLLNEAVEWYCDIYNPIESTPAHRLKDPFTGILDTTILPHADTLSEELHTKDYQGKLIRSKNAPRIVRCRVCGYVNRLWYEDEGRRE